MEFAARLVYLRKQKGFSQQALADAVGIHVSQIKRYEGGATQPQLDALKKIAIALGVSADALLFDDGERGLDEVFRLQLDVISHLDEDEQRIIREVIDGMLFKYQARRWSAPPIPQAKRPSRSPAK
ncbi:helix-turn-helix domain-containing protein [Holophaga foetida]|uniref:helix-turn-helix domain-containing protein n=1 Tax=Holophaga foetida TaxID=35839 RepID=UPI000698968B